MTHSEIHVHTVSIHREAEHMLHGVPHVTRMPTGSPYTQEEDREMYASLLQTELDIYKDPSTNIVRRISRLRIIAATAVVAMCWETRALYRELRKPRAPN